LTDLPENAMLLQSVLMQRVGQLSADGDVDETDCSLKVLLHLIPKAAATLMIPKAAATLVVQIADCTECC